MKKHLSNGYKLSTYMRMLVGVLFTLIGYMLFGFEVALYTIIVTILSHELPTMIMGIYIYRKLNKEGLINDLPEEM